MSRLAARRGSRLSTKSVTVSLEYQALSNSSNTDFTVQFNTTISVSCPRALPVCDCAAPDPNKVNDHVAFTRRTASAQMAQNHTAPACSTHSVPGDGGNGLIESEPDGRTRKFPQNSAASSRVHGQSEILPSRSAMQGNGLYQDG